MKDKRNINVIYSSLFTIITPHKKVTFDLYNMPAVNLDKYLEDRDK